MQLNKHIAMRDGHRRLISMRIREIRLNRVNDIRVREITSPDYGRSRISENAER
ncbi:hypothetical protein DPMN_086090 [Dreissena polymorpha]|uniref:Uncharacterized protein n=1 Tax=Dreissena polymorpha TaxID=45954 RepID=A0A9D4BKW0_DREPO|nr:hypothetical protein DPMN_086090 [Dreissena polymorpha]